MDKREKRRIQLELPKECFAHIERMINETGTTTYRNLFLEAITLLEVAVEEIKMGNKIGFQTPNGEFRPLISTMLRNVRTSSNE